MLQKLDHPVECQVKITIYKAK